MYRKKHIWGGWDSGFGFLKLPSRFILGLNQIILYHNFKVIVVCHNCAVNSLNKTSKCLYMCYVSW